MSHIAENTEAKPYNLTKSQVQLIVRGLYSLRSKVSDQPEALEELRQINNLLLEEDEESSYLSPGIL